MRCIYRAGLKDYMNSNVTTSTTTTPTTTTTTTTTTVIEST